MNPRSGEEVPEEDVSPLDGFLAPLVGAAEKDPMALAYFRHPESLCGWIADSDTFLWAIIMADPQAPPPSDLEGDVWQTAIRLGDPTHAEHEPTLGDFRAALETIEIVRLDIYPKTRTNFENTDVATLGWSPDMQLWTLRGVLRGVFSRFGLTPDSTAPGPDWVPQSDPDLVSARILRSWDPVASYTLTSVTEALHTLNLRWRDITLTPGLMIYFQALEYRVLDLTTQGVAERDVGPGVPQGLLIRMEGPAGPAVWNTTDAWITWTATIFAQLRLHTIVPSFGVTVEESRPPMCTPERARVWRTWVTQTLADLRSVPEFYSLLGSLVQEELVYPGDREMTHRRTLGSPTVGGLRARGLLRANRSTALQTSCAKLWFSTELFPKPVVHLDQSPPWFRDLVVVATMDHIFNLHGVHGWADRVVRTTRDAVPLVQLLGETLREEAQGAPPPRLPILYWWFGEWIVLWRKKAWVVGTKWGEGEDGDAEVPAIWGATLTWFALVAHEIEASEEDDDDATFRLIQTTRHIWTTSVFPPEPEGRGPRSSLPGNGPPEDPSSLIVDIGLSGK